MWRTIGTDRHIQALGWTDKVEKDDTGFEDEEGNPWWVWSGTEHLSGWTVCSAHCEDACCKARCRTAVWTENENVNLSLTMK